MTTYELCKQLLARGKLTAQMLDVYFAAGRLTPEQYAELMAAIQPEAPQSSNQA